MPVRDKEKYNEYMRVKILERYYERRRFALDKLGGVCVRCFGDTDLQFDHIDRDTKSFPISKLWSVSIKKFLAELEKCQILCSLCHKDKTRECKDFYKLAR